MSERRSGHGRNVGQDSRKHGNGCDWRGFYADGRNGGICYVEQIETARAAYKVVASKVSTEGGAVAAGSTDYTVDHSDIIYLMDKNGVFADFFSSRSTPQDIAVRVRQELMKSDK